jgi:hypothetical protein
MGWIGVTVVIFLIGLACTVGISELIIKRHEREQDGMGNADDDSWAD